MKLHDIYETVRSIELGNELFGYSAQFAKDYDEATKALGRAICTEKGISPQDGLWLPKDTEFSSAEVVDAFAKLRSLTEKLTPE